MNDQEREHIEELVKYLQSCLEYDHWVQDGKRTETMKELGKLGFHRITLNIRGGQWILERIPVA